MRDTYYFEKGPSREPLVRPEKLIGATLERGLKLVGWNKFLQYAKAPADYPREAEEVSGLFDVFVFVRPHAR
jgi:hypothetical protein